MTRSVITHADPESLAREVEAVLGEAIPWAGLNGAGGACGTHTVACRRRAGNLTCRFARIFATSFRARLFSFSFAPFFFLFLSIDSLDCRCKRRDSLIWLISEGALQGQVTRFALNF